MSPVPLIIPELDVTDLSVSLKFNCEILGFQVLYDRPEERFAMIDLAGARLMLEQADGPGRRFRIAPLEQPFGRGVNFQIEIADVRATCARVVEIGPPCSFLWNAAGIGLESLNVRRTNSSCVIPTAICSD